MSETVYQMDQVIIAGDMFAEDLMRRVINRKQQRRSHLKSWSSRGYSRITLESQRGVVLVAENVFDAYREAERGDREIIRSRRETARFYEDLGIDIVPLDLSADNVEINGLQFIGPTHPDALEHYYFSFAGTRKYGDQDVYDLFIAPKVALHPTFIGSVAILDSTYVLIGSDLRIARHVEFDSYIRRWDVAYQQQFAAIDSFWLPMGLLAEGVIHVDPEESGLGPAGFRQVALLQNHEVNHQVPEEVYAEDRRLTVDEASVIRDDLFLMGRDIVALSPEEVVAHERLSYARLTLLEALPSIDPADIPRVVAEMPPEGDQPQFVWPRLWGAEPWLRFNRVDGYLIGLGYASEFRSGNSGLRVAKTVGDNATLFAIRASTQLTTKRKATILVERDNKVLRNSRFYSTTLNSITARLGEGDYFDYMRQFRVRGRMDYSATRKVRIGVGAQWARHLSLEQVFKRAWPAKTTFPANPLIDRKSWYTLGASLTMGDHWQPFRLGPMQRIELSASRMMSSEGDWYERYELWSDTFLKTFQPNRPGPMGLSLRAFTQRTRGNPPIEGLIALDGSIGPVSTFGTLRSLRRARHIGKHTVGLAWEHDFRTVLWELLGLRFLTEWRTGITIGGAHGRVWPSEEDFHHEVTASLTEVFSTPLRVDLTRRLDVPGWFVSVGLSRKLPWGSGQ